MRDSFVFYRSFFEALSQLSEEDRLALYDAICEFSLNDEFPQLEGARRAIFELVKPQIEANNRRYENGRKGGRPKGKRNQEKTKEKPNVNQEKTKCEPNVNVNVNDNDKPNYRGLSLSSDEETKKAKEEVLKKIRR